MQIGVSASSPTPHPFVSQSEEAEFPPPKSVAAAPQLRSLGPARDSASPLPSARRALWVTEGAGR